MLKTYTALALFITLLLISACAHPDQPPLTQAQHLLDRGEQVYLEYCAECHQRDGSGWMPLYPKFAGNPIITLHDPEPIIVTVLYGQGSMPAFRTRLPTDDLAAVLTYIRNAWGNSASPISPRQLH
jgi:mono/diheme cytochrome c family protein